VLALAAGAGLFAAALTVRYRDVQYLLPVLVQMVLYASPVAYSLSVLDHAHPMLRWAYLLNPLTGVLEAFRWSLLGLGRLNGAAVAYSAAVAAATLVGGVVSFRRMERDFADVI